MKAPCPTPHPAATPQHRGALRLNKPNLTRNQRTRAHTLTAVDVIALLGHKVLSVHVHFPVRCDEARCRVDPRRLIAEPSQEEGDLLLALGTRVASHTVVVVNCKARACAHE